VRGAANYESTVRTTFRWEEEGKKRKITEKGKEKGEELQKQR